MTLPHHLLRVGCDSVPGPSLKSDRSAFTLVEVIVVIAIIGMLLGLVLPGIQAARESARRMQCQHNLVQLILAVNSYEMAHSVLPPGTIAAQGPIASVPTGYHHSWIIQILPYLDQQNAYNHFDHSLSVYDSKNSAVRKIGMRVLHCPTTSRISGYSTYAGVHHDVESPIDTANHGVFFLNSHLPLEDISDGAAQTLFVGEKLVLNGDLGWASGTRATLRNTGTRLNAARLALANSADGLAPPEQPPGSGGTGAETPDAAAAANAAAANGQPAGPLAVGGFSSYHPGGANFAFGDGSVSMISDAISPQVYQQLGHRSDGGLLDFN